MRVECYSVRLVSLNPISAKAYKAVSFDGKEDIIPASQVYGRDYEVEKSDAYWITSWILSKKDIQYSRKKVGWFDKETGRQLPTYSIEHHKPQRINAVESNEIASLKSE